MRIFDRVVIFSAGRNTSRTFTLDVSLFPLVGLSPHSNLVLALQAQLEPGYQTVWWVPSTRPDLTCTVQLFAATAVSAEEAAVCLRTSHGALGSYRSGRPDLLYRLHPPTPYSHV